ncbi:hypothetical protein COB21_04890 [Candidatus Aerophobetes bacterium]|uniref:N-acetyltransferase domain-containing protein n=1 Tax=Aerophobetes bacterium TaxID=2030807 RepID=A0A2A4X1U7_UNCAE|nr:MAG: hypothetical protein COB21_04890 [Candidatus Aerophobetes bacterium]
MIDLTESGDFDIRYTYGADYNAILALIKEQSVDLAVSSSRDMENFARNWTYMGKYKASLTLLYKGLSIGFAALFLMPYKKTKHLCQGYILIEKQYRNQGIEMRAIKNLSHLAEHSFDLSTLHFKEFDGCFLSPFLEQSGYKLLYRQEKYVKVDGQYRGRSVYERKFDIKKGALK